MKNGRAYSIPVRNTHNTPTFLRSGSCILTIDLIGNKRIITSVRTEIAPTATPAFEDLSAHFPRYNILVGSIGFRSLTGQIETVAPRI
jgi:hypothetical protein